MIIELYITRLVDIGMYKKKPDRNYRIQRESRSSFHFLNFDDLGLLGLLFSVPPPPPVPEPLVLVLPALLGGFAAILTDFFAAEPTGRLLFLGVFGVVPLLGVFLLLFSDVVVARPIFAISLVMSTTALETLFSSPF